MDQIYQLIFDAPDERLAIVLLLFFIGLLVAAIRALWKRIRELESEVENVHELQRNLILQTLTAIGGHRGAPTSSEPVGLPEIPDR